MLFFCTLRPIVGRRAFDYAGKVYRLIPLLLFPIFVLHAAEVYKSVDQHGNTVFSDVPSDNAEKIEVGEVPTIPGLKERPAGNLQPTAVERYSALAITSPVNDETYFRSEGDLVVSVRTEPRLNPGDTIVLYLNSNEFLSGKSLTYSIPELDRGTYQLRVAIKDSAGKVIKSSETITFHLRQTSVLHPRPAAN